MTAPIDPMMGANVLQCSDVALGTEQTSRRLRSMSALPPKADIADAMGNVRFVPIADIAGLFDHLVSNGEHTGRNSQTQSLGGLEVDHQFVLGG